MLMNPLVAPPIHVSTFAMSFTTKATSSYVTITNRVRKKCFVVLSFLVPGKSISRSPSLAGFAVSGVAGTRESPTERIATTIVTSPL